MLSTAILRNAVNAASSKPAAAASHFKITLMRSSIGLTPDVRKTVAALGFKKRMQSVYRSINEKNVGRIVKVKELVKVETMDAEQVEEECRPKIRAENRGYTVVGRAL